MTSSTESPICTDATPTPEGGAPDLAGTEPAALDATVAASTPDIGSPDDPSGRSFGRVRGQRLEITKADLTMYSAITGRAPSREERERALTWSEADPLHEQIADRRGVAVARSGARSGSRSGSRHNLTATLPMHSLRPWHPAALSLRLRDIWFNGLTLRSTRPQISTWVRRLSLALNQGRQRVKQPR